MYGVIDKLYYLLISFLKTAEVKEHFEATISKFSWHLPMPKINSYFFILQSYLCVKNEKSHEFLSH